ncbi:MAG: 4Fe-4S dicluster domain-containing protein [Desulfarculaceae bacterium]|nr:4Fe-4S dicluster domain-containing protein [Desulfarculaceae bacterium]MCF8074124.1 4Fe-4S dicluster domain-containing protein [Desulfarculaceae bacterium]MCF8103284.1 4Fe-4S dicluster domain-containing protein [Desulfarculaceae bacterium]MCF8116858.1 4Fe-4S dicluster domain-containing protein [Desulfarculaceae bacterium]
MAKDVFQKLAHHLDSLPGGFPPTKDGVELKILKKLFSPAQAELALHCTLIPEPARVVARRAKLPLDEARTRLDEMVDQGLILGIYPKQGEPLYMAAQYVIGIWEYNVNNLDEELVGLMNAYIPTLFDPEIWKEAPQLRTIPVGKSIDAAHRIMPHEQAEELIRRQKKLHVAPCICRREHTMVGKGCGKEEETCLVFGAGAYYYEHRGVGRSITQEEALEIIKKADEQGLVLQPSNAEKIINICCCCGDCCQVLKTLKRYPRPAELAATPFVAEAQPEECIGCGVCLERCQMDALSLDDEEKVVLAVERCIGCGLCVSTCPSGALTLERKPEDEQKTVPANVKEMGMGLARARGKLSGGQVAMMGIKSKLDRLLAAKK